MWELLVVGIDPGTKTGYAALGLSGELKAIGSEKGIGFEQLVSRVLEHGVPVVVGCDKATPPVFVARFCRATGARLIAPKSDMKLSEKRELPVHVKPSNAHERDALAAAFYAFKRSRPLIQKLKRATSDISDQNAKQMVFKKVLRAEGINIIDEIRLRAVAEQANLNTHNLSPVHPKPTTVNPVSVLKRELELLRAQNKGLQRECLQIRERLAGLAKRYERSFDNTLEKHVSEKEERIKRLAGRSRDFEKTLTQLKESLSRGEAFVSKFTEGVILLKHLPDLRWESLTSLNPHIKIGQGDTLLVDDPNQFNTKTLEFLKGKVERIVCKTLPNKSIEGNFVFIRESEDKIAEWRGFVLVKRSSLEKSIAKSGLLSQIVDGYRRERQEELSR